MSKSLLKTPYRLLSTTEREFRNWICERKESLKTKAPISELRFRDIVEGLRSRMHGSKFLNYERQKEFIPNRAITNAQVTKRPHAATEHWLIGNLTACLSEEGRIELQSQFETAS